MTTPVTPAAPSAPTDQTTPPTTDPAATTPPAAPVPTPPAQPATGEPAATQADEGKTFTQADLDRILTDRLARERKASEDKQAEFNKKLAALFGGTTPEDGRPTGEQLIEQMQGMVAQAQDRANTATADAAARLAVRDDRVGALLAMVDVKAALKDVDASDTAKVNEAIKKAVDAKAAEFPEWKRTAIPGASTANPNGGGAAGKPTYTRDQLAKMSADELAKIADDLPRAYAEGRIS